jgi:hypothetical protein
MVPTKYLEPPQQSPPRAGFSGERSVSPQLGPRTEERETFTRLLGLPYEGRLEGVRYE